MSAASTEEKCVTSGLTQKSRDRLYSRYLSSHVQPNPDELFKMIHRRKSYLTAFIRRCIGDNRSLRVLDLGCGHGAMLQILKEMGFDRISGIDTSPEQVALAHSLGLQEVRQADLFKGLDQTLDASCDVVIAFDVLEHFGKEDVLRMLDGMHRVLAPSGKLLLHVPNGEAIFGSRVFFSDFTHEVAFTPVSIRQLASVCGFSKTEVIEESPVVHGVTSAIRFVLWKVIRTAYRLFFAIETGDHGRDLVLSQNVLAILIR